MSGAVSVVATESSYGAGFDLLYLEAGERGPSERRASLLQCWNTRFESTPPVRTFPSYRGQRNFPGLWWSATTGEHVGFESWLERDQVMMLDFAPQVVGFSSQPFWLLWSADSKCRRHAPDFFARLADGTGVVIDVRADDRIEPKDAEAFAVTAAACELVGWRYRRVGELDPVLAANVGWLAGYRHPRYGGSRFDDQLRRVFHKPALLLEGVRAVGDPIAVLPALFHLVWRGVLTVDLSAAPLSGTSVVVVGGER